MIPSGILASLLALTAVAAPAPAPAANKPSGPVSLPLKRTVNTTPTRRDSTNAPLTVFGKEMYYSTTISVGTPPQKVEVLIDTGSIALWIGDDANHFDHTRSSTFKYVPDRNGNKLTWEIPFLKGFANGYMGEDTVALGAFVQPGQRFNAATTWNHDALPGNNSGLIGFGWPQNGIPDPLWYQMAQTWEDKRFGIYLGRATGAPNVDDPSAGGLLTLGGVEESLFTGNINYLPLLRGKEWYDIHWVVTGDAIKVNGQTIDLGNNIPIMADTGVTLILGSKADVAKLYAQVPGAVVDQQQSEIEGWLEMYKFPCDADFDISFQFGGETFPVTKNDLIHRRQGNVCLGGVAGADVDYWIVGDLFLKTVYSVHRIDPPGLAFAKLK